MVSIRPLIGEEEDGPHARVFDLLRSLSGGTIKVVTWKPFGEGNFFVARNGSDKRSSKLVEDLV